MADIFISYVKTDRPLASKLAAMLEAEGWKVWWDTSLTILLSANRLSFAPG
jgi:TIR domain-containing protein